DPLSGVECSPREHADVAGARYAALTAAHGFRPEFDAVLRAAEERADDPTTRAYLRAQRVSLLALAGRFHEAIALAPALDDGLDEVTALRLVPGLGAALIGLGKWDTAAAVADRMVESALTHRDDIPFAPFWVVSTQLMAYVGGGRLDDADALIE